MNTTKGNNYILDLEDVLQSPKKYNMFLKVHAYLTPRLGTLESP